jgi:hypothetical protein
MVGYFESDIQILATLAVKPEKYVHSLEFILLLSIFISPFFHVKASEPFIIPCLYLSQVFRNLSAIFLSSLYIQGTCKEKLFVM